MSHSQATTTQYMLVPSATDWWWQCETPITDTDIAMLCDADLHADCATEGDHPIMTGWCLRECVDIVPAELPA